MDPLGKAAIKVGRSRPAVGIFLCLEVFLYVEAHTLFRTRRKRHRSGRRPGCVAGTGCGRGAGRRVRAERARRGCPRCWTSPAPRSRRRPRTQKQAAEKEKKASAEKASADKERASRSQARTVLAADAWVKPVDGYVIGQPFGASGKHVGQQAQWSGLVVPTAPR
ncbi:hypothetical protein GCM10020221_01630 [Streptomyces thioluteus]|uniref:Transposase n=1 Tax=Streptomyces thioluteus TaxID=66431 RepID=A0ABN3WCA6_STRTU